MISDYLDLAAVFVPIVGAVLALVIQMLDAAGHRKRLSEGLAAPQLPRLEEFQRIAASTGITIGSGEKEGASLEEAKRCVRSEESRQGLRLTAAARAEAEARWRELSK